MLGCFIHDGFGVYRFVYVCQNCKSRFAGGMVFKKRKSRFAGGMVLKNVSRDLLGACFFM